MSKCRLHRIHGACGSQDLPRAPSVSLHRCRRPPNLLSTNPEGWEQVLAMGAESWWRRFPSASGGSAASLHRCRSLRCIFVMFFGLRMSVRVYLRMGVCRCVWARACSRGIYLPSM